MTLITPILAIVIGLAETCATNGQISVGNSYGEAVRRAGHIPLVIPRQTSTEAYDAVLSRVDILILTGGEDVAPERYGATREPALGGVNEKRDGFEYELLKAAVSRRLPIFGICRGEQMLNVFFGGTLHQDLPTAYGEKYSIEHRTGRDKRKAFAERRHEITVEPDSRLAKVMGKTHFGVNSLHHQAVKGLAPGFRVAARTADGSVEAIECDRYPAAGVQFHPEGLVYYGDEQEFLEIFKRLPELVGACGRESEH